MPLLPPLPADRWDDKARFAFAGMLPRERQNPEGAGTALATLARHPDLTKAFLGFSVHLLYRSTLPARLRELAILRVAYRRDCTYELTHHTELGREVGLSEDEIASAQRGEAADGFEQKLLAAVDELDETSRLSDRTWAALGERLDERQQMDLVFTIGGYTMMAMAFNTFGIELEQER
ncbi:MULTISPECIES: carboxymuconolactone decarboxylase family protein [Rhodococcus]|jgi:AhpD family alkylhydroperoxidase|uniref:Carboxymuconolactone decarboxylase family protein n=1 Tax=Rhodococcus oxybenzonivorans TaxID=1990687 RepID=A0AAE4V480_9NOCA|nr:MULTISPECIES: carboxymuconolactone decarboxylase family protein [Rhodococcus]MDV7240980.1 carboxymuconolactone decarboxylase family protein [Rhodococcus oxybenzonivorans]MDV7268288.1 carboxymuconolactone decarboxylase family protein [Rhodococcus oxybenzonivorans]MDV7273253.1 carboxymuconolactone decarboxylase family protein [Rhodococcus oxybenzonivorans]MDV7333009.1 carboxymuconolactone decarboxylase family protein [Rhodococcus oxybenzonivorans]MDV7342175.1 carboxymuconolactone decarboxylas